jgi:hypothetical protein
MTITHIAARSPLLALALAVPAAPAMAVPADLHASHHHDSALVRADGAIAPATPSDDDGAPWIVFGVGVGSALALGAGIGSLRPRHRRVSSPRAPRAV